MTVCAVLVLGMMPALGLFEAGLLREQNFVHILTQVFTGAAVLGLLWFLGGYSIVFGESIHGWIGNPATFFAGRGLRYWVQTTCVPGTTVPVGIHFLYQMMFAAITPLLITGASAERILFRPSVWFTVLFELLVYYPVAHWIWNPDGWLAKFGTRDFAGGIVIHATAGVSSLVLAKLLGKREIFVRCHGHVRPSSVSNVVTGGMMLWLGWFAFNGGSALAVWHDTVAAVLNTQLASCCGAVAALLVSSTFGQPNVVALLNGAIAGLAGVTPAAGYIEPWAGAVTGFVCGLAFVGSEELILHVFHIDDALGVSAVHGVPGVLGALITGFLAADHLENVSYGLVYGGGWSLLLAQVVGLAVAIAWAGVATVLIYYFLVLLYKGQVSAVDIRSANGVPADVYGLDIAEHGIAAKYTEVIPDSFGSPLFQQNAALMRVDGESTWLVDAPHRSFFGRFGARSATAASGERASLIPVGGGRAGRHLREMSVSATSGVHGVHGAMGIPGVN